MKNEKVVVLLSGGLDSCVVASICKTKNMEIHCLTFNYGQKHVIEIKKAKKIAKLLKVKSHKIIDMTFLSDLVVSSLTNKNAIIPENRKIEDMKNIPSTYVPGRNIIFLAIAAGYAESIKATKICIGAHSVDYSGYPDCKPDFLIEMEKTIKCGTNSKIEIFDPILYMNKTQIIKEGLKNKAPIKETYSCYNGEKTPCGKCDACIIRNKGFEEAEVC